MMKWSEERKRKHSQIMLEHIKNRKYDQIIKIRYDRIEREIHALWCEACPIAHFPHVNSKSESF